jgi:hypothetical protein
MQCSGRRGVLFSVHLHNTDTPIRAHVSQLNHHSRIESTETARKAGENSQLNHHSRIESTETARKAGEN